MSQTRDGRSASNDPVIAAEVANEMEDYIGVMPLIPYVDYFTNVVESSFVGNCKNKIDEIVREFPVLSLKHDGLMGRQGGRCSLATFLNWTNVN